MADLAQIRRSKEGGQSKWFGKSAMKQNFDPAGHYARPDVTQLTINRQRQ
jgi:hypothetical protein